MDKLIFTTKDETTIMITKHINGFFVTLYNPSDESWLNQFDEFSAETFWELMNTLKSKSRVHRIIL